MSGQTESKHYRRGERGNVLFYILIGVALIAALSFAVSGSLRGGAENLSRERTELYAVGILEYAGIVANAVGQIRLRGAGKTGIDFQNSDNTGSTGDYTNAFSSGDGDKIFHLSGGGVEYQNISSDAVDFACDAEFGGGGEWWFLAGVGIENVGSSSSELVMQGRCIKKAICLEINDTLGIPNPSDDAPSATWAAAVNFQGSYPDSATTTDDNIASKTAFCYTRTSNSVPGYFFVKALVVQ